MAVRKRVNKESNVWFVDVCFPNGERYRKTIGTKKVAQAEERRIQAEIQAGT